MGDSVGVSGPHFSHTLVLLKKVLNDNKINPGRIDMEAVNTFAAPVTSLSQHPLEEAQFLELITSHPKASAGWEHLKTLARAA